MKYHIILPTVIMHGSCSLNAMNHAIKAQIARDTQKNASHVYTIYDLRKAIQASNFDDFEKSMNYLAEKQYDFKNEKDTQKRNLLQLACLAERLNHSILKWLINLEIDPLYQSKKCKCAVELLSDKMKDDSRLDDLENLFSDEIWTAYEALKAVAKNGVQDQELANSPVITQSFATPLLINDASVALEIAGSSLASSSSTISDFDFSSIEIDEDTTANTIARNDNQKKSKFHFSKKNTLFLFCATAVTAITGFALRNRYIKNKHIKKNDAN